MRKRPRLRRVQAHVADDEARLLKRFARNRLFDRFARLDETRQRGMHALGPDALTAEQAFFAVRRQHNDNWIDARKMLALATWAFALPARFDDFRPPTAIGAKPILGVPFENRAGATQY